MKPEPNYDDYLQQWAHFYNQRNYDSGIIGYLLAKSHYLAERNYPESRHFARVLEVGAGTAMHIRAVSHSFEEYWLTDKNEAFLGRSVTTSGMAQQGQVITACRDATKLDFEDASFDRLIAAHVLEHIYEPHLALREWSRVVKPKGLITLVLPCDPGLGWRLGRTLFARPSYLKAGFDYDYWMAREHVNPINNLMSIVRYYFDDIDELWWPFRLPSIDLNLFVIVQIRT